MHSAIMGRGGKPGAPISLISACSETICSLTSAPFTSVENATSVTPSDAILIEIESHKRSTASFNAALSMVSQPASISVDSPAKNACFPNQTIVPRACLLLQQRQASHQ